MKPWIVMGVFCVLVACVGPGRVSDGSAARMDQVITGLRPSFAISGEAPVRWTLAERMQHYHVPGVSIAVIDSGRIVWAKGFGVRELGGTDSVTPQTLFQAGSISKPTFAVGVMRLVQDGRLDLDQDVNAKLVSWKVPENKFTAQEKVTLRRILSHSAGLTVHGFPGYEVGSRIPTVPEILDGEPPANTRPVRVDTVPGAVWRYSGGGTTVAMLLVTDVTRKPFPEFMQETVLGPAGMVHSTYEQPLPVLLAPKAASGHTQSGAVVPGKYHTYPEMSAAGLWTTPSDLATLAIELQRTHAGQSDKVINKAMFDQMLTVQKAPFGIGYELEGSGPTLEFLHGGDDAGFVAMFVAFAERGQGAVIMTNGDNGGDLIAELLPSIAAAYEWPHHQQDARVAIARDPRALAELAGVYRFDVGKPDPVLDTVTVENGKLYTAAGSTVAKEELLADTDTSFFSRNEGEPVVFVRDRSGHVSGVTIEGLTGTRIK
jgi:CubicO group peptidase (beta-lactamase class C family)